MSRKTIIVLCILVISLIQPVHASNISRSFSSTEVGYNQNVTVSLLITVTSGETIYAIDETIPEGWIIRDAGNGSTSESGHIKWLYYSNTTPAPNTTLIYVVTSPSQSGIYTFSGEYMFESMEETSPISGQNQVTVNTITPPPSGPGPSPPSGPGPSPGPGPSSDSIPACTNGETRECGPPSELNGVGICKTGTSTCVNGIWGECIGAIFPEDEICDGLDNNCNGEVDEICTCKHGDTRPCGTDVGVCEFGTS
ncbi:MAG TPA: hypothetical protein ENG00_00660, partial [Candidatus Aenigmarchaeota archaeon]|nr:hypothetical protein [Candidatus Aenigmarchaeota archaeon]